MAGTVASTVLSRMAVPILYYLCQKGGGQPKPLPTAPLAPVAG